MHTLSYFLFVLIFISCSINALKAQRPRIEDANAVVFPDDVTLPGDQYDIGRSYNTINNKVGRKVVLYTDNHDLKTISGAEGQKTIFDLQLIKSSEQLKKMMDLETNASLKWGPFKGSFKYKKFNDLKIDQYQTLLVAKVTVKNSPEILKKSRLTQRAWNIMNENTENYLETFGDEYIYGRVTGGELYIFFEFSSTSREEFTRTQAAAAAAFRKIGSGASASAGFTSALKELKSSSNLRFNTVREGTIDPVPQFDLDSLISYASNFPERVRTSENPVVLEVITEPIINTENMPRNIPKHLLLEMYMRKRKIESIAEKIDEINDAIASAEYIKANANLFRETAVDSAKDKLTDYKIISNQLQDCAVYCSVIPDRCDDCVNFLSTRYEPYITTLKNGDETVDKNKIVNLPEKRVGIPLSGNAVMVDTAQVAESVYLDFEGRVRNGVVTNCQTLVFDPSLGINQEKPFIVIDQLRSTNPSEVVESSYYDGKEIKLRKSGVIIRASIKLAKRSSDNSISILPVGAAWQECSPIKAIIVREHLR